MPLLKSVNSILVVVAWLVAMPCMLPAETPEEVSNRPAVSPEDVLEAVEAMSPEQVEVLLKKLDAKLWEPVPESIFTRLSVLVAGSLHQFETVDLAPLGLTASGVDLSDADGAEVALFWQVIDPGLRIGIRMAGWEVWDSSSTVNGYSRAELQGGSLCIAASYFVLRDPSWQAWVDIAVGGAAVVVETLDTPAGQPSTIRELDNEFTVGEVGAGVAWRFNPVLALFGSAAYRLAESADLNEADNPANVEVDLSGFTGRIGIAFGF
jgi:hypothetical protein